jgi:opacity protein-like surface antigen
MISQRYLLASLASTLALVASTSFSQVAAQPALDGFYVTGGFNSTTVEQNLTRNTGTNIPTDPSTGPANGPSITASNRETDFGIALGVGYHWDVSDDFFLAAEVFYSDENTETQVINNVLVNDVELNSTYGIDLKAGHNVTEKFAVYGLMSATAYDFDSTISYTFAPPVDRVSEDEFAFTYGGGVEIALNDNWSTFAEVRIANDLDFTTPTDRGGIDSQNELNFNTIKTGLKYSF